MKITKAQIKVIRWGIEFLNMEQIESILQDIESEEK